MGLSPDVVQAHVEDWTKKFKSINRPYKANWPSRLFRHEPIQNAVEILKSGVLLSRNDAVDRIALDIAPEDIIQRNDRAHGYVRLYFRPNSPTQFRIEGIRKPHEIYHGRHAPVLVVLVFNALDILTASDARFSDGNMQSASTRVGSTDEEFQALPFDRIYHEGAFERGSPLGDDIVRCRCAEVLLSSPLELLGSLRGILCRSPAERSTLLHLLGENANYWRDRVRVFRESGLFQNKYAYLYSVDADENGIVFNIHSRSDGQSVKTQLWIFDQRGNLIVETKAREINTKTKWRFSRGLDSGVYIVRFKIEDCFAHESTFIIDDIPF